MDKKTLKKITALRDSTYKEAKEIIEEYGKVAIIRPTGFGKTGLLTRFIRSYKKVLYLYPADVVMQAVLRFYYHTDNPTKDTIPGVIFMTYKKLIMLTDQDYEDLKDVDLIIADECHRLGAAETMYSMTELLKGLPNVHLLGATATPERMDMVDEIAIFFDDHITSEYTLHDAIQDGILQKPYYFCCMYNESDKDSLAQLEKELGYELIHNKDAKDMNKEDLEEMTTLLKARTIEFANLMQMDLVIKQAMEAAKIADDYQRFIVFCENFNRLKVAKRNVKRWFKKAYPHHKINITEITSETKETHDNVDELLTMAAVPKTIDIIFCCDMMNMGYHVKELTGIIMYRATYSGTIYTQQLGRVLSTGTDRSAVVIDVAQNLYRKSKYAMLSEYSDIYEIVSPEDRERYKELVRKTNDKTPTGEPVKLTVEEKEEFVKLSRLIRRAEVAHQKKHCNDIFKTDLVATSHEATYRELIRKTIAEAKSMRCRQAFARWVEKGGDPSVMTREAILSQQPPQAVPLPPFCRLKNVSVNAVLDEMGVFA